MRYFNLCKCMQIDLGDGYLFRSTDKHGRVSIANNPFIGSSIAARLKTHPSHLGIADGETMHSFRSGCSITLSMLRASIEDIATHVGWRSTESVQYSHSRKSRDVLFVTSLNHVFLVCSFPIGPSSPWGPHKAFYTPCLAYFALFFQVHS